jgi:2-hydroxy-3-keto-5-methylthiopentenyl-1-phosphate phosphatase
VTNREAPLNRRRVQDLSVDRMFNDIHKDLDEAINYYPKINLKAGADIVVDWCRENNLI